jgi:hypothetical protein
MDDMEREDASDRNIKAILNHLRSAWIKVEQAATMLI